MQNPLLLTLFVVGVALFFLCYFVSALFYRKRHETKYHFYQMFPYEFNYPRVFRENLYGNLLFGISCFAIAAFYIVNPLSSIYTYFTLALAIILTMLFLCLLMMPLQYLRTHIAFATIAMTISAALPLFNLFNALEQLKVATDNKPLCIVSMIISGLLALMMVALILNPKLTYKIYYEKKTDENGKEIIQRPKIIVAALSEWWTIFTFIFSPLAILFLFI